MLTGPPCFGRGRLFRDWELTAKYLGDENYARLSLKIEDGKLTGTMNEIKLEGTVKDVEELLRQHGGRQ